MTSAEAIGIAAHEPLSMKTACIGFVASTTALTLIMVFIGNLV